MNILYLSPHYDDAVYSCGGAIHTAAQRQPVQVLTLMAGEPQPPYPDSPIIRELHRRWEAGEHPVQERRQEDQTAAQILGCVTAYAEITDCIYRSANGQALYPSEESLWSVVHPDDPAHQALRQIALPATRALTIFAPLGAGQHVDHLIVRDWALELIPQHPEWEFWFYEDFPYLRQRDAVDAALEALPWISEISELPIAEESIRARIAAMCAYRSQVSSFWRHESEIEHDVRLSFSDASGRFVERCYRVSWLGA